MSMVNKGSRVRINLNGQIKDIEIVEPSEIDPRQGKISAESAIGQAILGSRGGQVQEIKTPNGETVKLKIESIIK